MLKGQQFYNQQKSILIILISTMLFSWAVLFGMDLMNKILLENRNGVICQNETMVILFKI